MTKFESLLLTVFGVIALGGGFGLNLLYLTLQDKPKSDQITMGTFGSILNTAVVLWLGILIVVNEPFVSKWKGVLILSFLLIGWIVEVYFLATDPQVGSSKESIFAYTILSLNTIFRLFVLIAVRCTSSVVVQTITKAAVETGKDLSGIDINNIWDRSVGLFSNVLRSTTKTEEEKIELMNKFRSAFGKEPRVPKEGGRRR